MKIFKTITAFSILFGTISLVSCSEEIEPLDPYLAESITPPTATSIVGTYLLTGYNTAVPTDLNRDGILSSNQMSETACFNNMKLKINANGSFVADSQGVEVNAASNGVQCFTDPDYSGNWSLTEGLLTLIYMDGTQEITTNFIAMGNTLKLAVSGADFVTSNSNQFEYMTGNVEIVYTRQ